MLQKLGEAPAIWPSCLKCPSYKGVHLKESEQRTREQQGWTCGRCLFQKGVHPGLEIASDMVANATNIFSLATLNSGLVATLATRLLYDLDSNLKSKIKTNISSYFSLLSS